MNRICFFPIPMVRPVALRRQFCECCRLVSEIHLKLGTWTRAGMLLAMATYSESPLDRLWKEYSALFREWDDLTLARWMAQTLGQIEGRVWRLSHPLLGAYRIGAQLAHDRQIWHKRLATTPQAYPESSCCRAPLLPLLTRDVLDAGLVCQHCGETC